ncbi:MAG: glucosamine-6-phosphate deaminase [Mycobacterium leprae]
MERIVTGSPAEFSRRAAAFVAERVARKPEAVLAMPTGSSPEGMYAELVRMAQAGTLDLSRATLFNLDEYLGLPPTDPQSYARFMQVHLLDRVKVAEHHIPNGLAGQPEAEAQRYERLIQEAGGIDLAVLGLGGNGHIGFNEPGSPFDSRTRVVTLSTGTREANSRFFGAVERVPERAITVGIATLMEAREILLLVTGRGKEAALQAATLEQVTPAVPASILRQHPRVTVLLSPEYSKLAE